MEFSVNTVYEKLSPYPVMILLSVAAGISLQYYLNRKRGIDKTKALCLLLLEPVLCFAAGFLMTYYSSGKTVFGLSSMGGLAGMYAASLFVALVKRKYGETGVLMQNCTFVLPLIYSISKIGCLFAGCCHGIEYDGIFSIKYIRAEDSITVFPVQAAETLVFAVIFAAGMMLLKKRKNSSVFVVFMLSAVSKGMLDFLRISHSGKIITFNQILCIILIASGFAVRIINQRKSEKLLNNQKSNS